MTRGSKLSMGSNQQKISDNNKKGPGLREKESKIIMIRGEIERGKSCGGDSEEYGAG